VKLGDFGLARVLDDGDMAQTIAGSPRYMAPEILGAHAERITPHYSNSADLWSLGALAYELLVGHALYHEASTPQELMAMVEHNDMELPLGALPPSLSKACVSFVRMLLAKDSTQRPSWACCRIHPWLHGMQSAGRFTPSPSHSTSSMDASVPEPEPSPPHDEEDEFHIGDDDTMLTCTDMSSVQVLTRVVDGLGWLFTLSHDAMHSPSEKQQGVQWCHMGLDLTRALQAHVTKMYLLHPVCDRLDDYEVYNKCALRRALGWGSVYLSPGDDGTDSLVQYMAAVVEREESNEVIARHYTLLCALHAFRMVKQSPTLGALLKRCLMLLQAMPVKSAVLE
jgi:hypothetical protein